MDAQFVIHKMQDVSPAAPYQSPVFRANYFSTVIKTKTGQTVSEWIAAKVIQEAKSQLSKSTASVKEIAFKLGFSEANYFSKYFKKHTGQSPGAFRKVNSCFLPFYL